MRKEELGSEWVKRRFQKLSGGGDVDLGIFHAEVISVDANCRQAEQTKAQYRDSFS